MSVGCAGAAGGDLLRCCEQCVLVMQKQLHTVRHSRLSKLNKSLLAGKYMPVGREEEEDRKRGGRGEEGR